MSQRIWSHLRSNVVAYVAVFIALGGGAYAATAHKIGGNQIKRGAIRSKQVKNQSLRTKDIKSLAKHYRALHGLNVAYYRSGGVRDQLAALNADVASLKSRVSALEANSGSLQGQISALQSQLNALSGKLGSIPGGTDLQSEIDSITNSLATQANQIANAQTAAAGAMSKAGYLCTTLPGIAGLGGVSCP